MDPALLAQLGGTRALVLKEMGDFDKGEGMRVSLLAHHLLIQVEAEGVEAHLLLDVDLILDGIEEMNKVMGS